MCVGVLFAQSHDCFSASHLLSCCLTRKSSAVNAKAFWRAKLVGIDRVIILNADLFWSSKDQSREGYERRERSQRTLVPSEGALRV